MYIVLLPIRHEHADDPLPAQRPNHERRHYRAVLAPGDAHHGVAAGAVLLEPVSGPLYQIFRDLLHIESHRCLLICMRIPYKT